MSRRGDYRRACDICGYEELFSKMRYVGEGRYACRDDRKGLTAQQISRHNGNVKPLTVRSRRHPRISTEVPTFQLDEALVVSSPLVAGMQANSPWFDVTSGDGALLDGAGADIEALHTIGALSWSVRHLAAMITENVRPLSWITRARTTLRTLTDALVARQILSEIGPSDDVAFGCFKRFLGDNYDDGILYSEDCAHGGLAYLAAYAILGDRKYIDYAKDASHGLRGFQLSGDHGVSQIPVAYINGPWSNNFDTGDNREYDGRFYVSSLVCLEFLTALFAVTGDFICGIGGDVNGAFNDIGDEGLLLSLCISGARSFWTAGTYDVVTNTTYTGLSAATPRELFNTLGSKQDGDVVGTGGWQYESGTAITGRRWAQAISSLYALDGMTDRVRSLYDFVRSFGSSTTFETPAGTSTKAIYEGLTGTYDPTMALATLMDVSTLKNSSAYYDWSTVGLLAPLQSVLDSAGLLRAKTELGKARKRFRENTTRDDQRDTALQRGRTGLTFQTSWTASVLVDGVGRRVHDAEAMAMAAMAYRYAPKVSNQLQG